MTNHGATPQRLDAVLTQDPALAHPDAVRTNEYYVSQYLDVSPIETGSHGTALAVRQNMPGPAAPWLVVGCLDRAVGWATDAHQLLTCTPQGAMWTGLEADLPSRRLQHEHTLVALQAVAVDLGPGDTVVLGFAGLLLRDHPDATGPGDSRHLDTALAAFAPLAASPVEATSPTPSDTDTDTGHLLASAPVLGAEI